MYSSCTNALNKVLTQNFPKFKMQSKANIYFFGMIVKSKVYGGSKFSCDTHLYTAYKKVK